MLCQFGREAGVIKDEVGAGRLGHQFEPGNRIDAFRPRNNPPSLHDEVVRDQLQVSSYDVARKQRERTSDIAVNLGRTPPRKRGELLSPQRFIIRLGSALKSISWWIAEVATIAFGLGVGVEDSCAAAAERPQSPRAPPAITWRRVCVLADREGLLVGLGIRSFSNLTPVRATAHADHLDDGIMGCVNLHRAVWVVLALVAVPAADAATPSLDRQFEQVVRPFVVKYCVACHSRKMPAAQFHLKSYVTVDAVAADLPRWALVVRG